MYVSNHKWATFPKTTSETRPPVYRRPTSSTTKEVKQELIKNPFKIKAGRNTNKLNRKQETRTNRTTRWLKQNQPEEPRKTRKPWLNNNSCISSSGRFSAPDRWCIFPSPDMAPLKRLSGTSTGLHSRNHCWCSKWWNLLRSTFGFSLHDDNATSGTELTRLTYVIDLITPIVTSNITVIIYMNEITL